MSHNLQFTKGFNISFSNSEKHIITPVQLVAAHLYNEQTSINYGNYKALWDTGATRSCIVTSLAVKLKLKCYGQIEVLGHSGVHIVGQYLIGLVLPNSINIPNIFTMGFDGSKDFDIIIGMDIISKGDFLISSYNNIMNFSFQIPSFGGFILKDIQNVKLTNGKKVKNRYSLPLNVNTPN